MFKRLFFLSGIIAFVLALAVMYFWYLPSQQQAEQHMQREQVAQPDTINADAVVNGIE